MTNATELMRCIIIITQVPTIVTLFYREKTSGLVSSSKLYSSASLASLDFYIYSMKNIRTRTNILKATISPAKCIRCAVNATNIV